MSKGNAQARIHTMMITSFLLICGLVFPKWRDSFQLFVASCDQYTDEGCHFPAEALLLSSATEI